MEIPQKYVVIDDDATNNLICELNIRKFKKDAEIQLFQDPEIALAAIRSGKCGTGEKAGTTIFLDINMPSMTGFELLEEFQKFPEHLQEEFNIYILTSSIEDFSSEAKLYPFVRGFLSKPLRISHLEEISENEIPTAKESRNC